MPESSRRSRHPYQRSKTLAEAAHDGLLLVVSCTTCRRTTHYLAADLAKILDPFLPAHLPPFPCSRCGAGALMHVTLRNPMPGDYGSLLVRRPGAVKKTQLWRTVRLGDR